jgi:glycosyltransferase involved in cell wall biosynthesis
MSRSPRVTFLTIMPSPYSRDLFAAIRADGRVQLEVLYMEMSAPDTRWGEVPLRDHERVLPGGWRNVGGGRVHWNPGVIRALRQSQPDLVVVAGYSSLTSQLAMRWLQRSRTPWIFWGESPGMRRLSGARAWLRTAALCPAVRWPHAIAAIGSGAVEAYRQTARKGIPVVNLPYYTELESFMNCCRQRSSSRVRILYCGQLIERKGLLPLLEAFTRLARDCPAAELMLVGSGPLEPRLKAVIPHDLQGRILFAGFQQVAALPQFFADSDVVVLPSLHDGWGVVVNQALGAGLPIVCTTAVGAARDLVTPGWNGAIVPPDDARALADELRRLISDPALRSEYSRNSRIRADEWTPAHGADRWVTLVHEVLATHRQASPVEAVSP